MAPSNPIRLLIADDHPVVRRGLMSVLESYPELNVVGGVASGKAALASLESTQVDVLLLDLRMPEMGGLETLQAIRESENGPYVIILTSYETDEDIYQAIVSGARGYLMKASPDEDILEAIHRVAGGGRHFAPQVLTRFAELLPRGMMTPFEVSLIDALANGCDFHELAQRLGTTQHAVQHGFDELLTRLVSEHAMQKAGFLPEGAVTIDEVARRAGVSIATVSRVLHNKGNHSERTCLAVMQAVRECGFQLNRSAASLAMRRTRG